MFKPLYGRKTSEKPHFHPINPYKILSGELEFMPFLLLGKTRFQDGFTPPNSFAGGVKYLFIYHIKGNYTFHKIEVKYYLVGYL